MLRSPFRYNFLIKNGVFKRLSRSFASIISEENIVKSPHPPLSFPELSIDQFVWRDVEFFRNKVAVVDGITDRSLTYSQLRDKSRALAVRMRTVLKLNEDEVIALCLPNSIEFPLIMLAAMEAGICVTTVNPVYTASNFNKNLNISYHIVN